MPTNAFVHTLDSIRRIAGILAALTMFGVLVLFVSIRGPAIEAKLLPIWTDVVLEFEPSSTAYEVAAGVYGTRWRKECRFLEVTSLVRQSKGYWVRAEMLVDGRPIRGNTRPEGWQHMGSWTFRPGGDKLRIYLYYRCHDLWDTPVFLGEWDTPVSWGKP
jgi:hypothetical protein